MTGSPRYLRAQAFEKMLALREQARSQNLRNRVESDLDWKPATFSLALITTTKEVSR